MEKMHNKLCFCCYRCGEEFKDGEDCILVKTEENRKVFVCSDCAKEEELEENKQKLENLKLLLQILDEMGEEDE